MLKHLFPALEWDKVKVAGFDLDGTLYDEMEFIAQVYQPIAQLIAKQCGQEPKKIYNWMLHRWLEKGSSYSYIFSEALSKHGFNEESPDMVISECLTIFRKFRPTLNLPARVAAILDAISNRCDLFLVTDGSATLQNEKIKALGLHAWFKSENIFISGEHGEEYGKPSCKILKKIKLLENIKKQETVFFGDRDVDQLFAQQANFQYQQVFCLKPIVQQ